MIDASVAQEAGGVDATSRDAKRSRDLLVAVLEICHRCVFTPAIQDEWRRHRSRFALRWQRQMYARKKVAQIDAPPADKIAAAIDALNPWPREREVLEKDALLVGAALVSDGIVVSRDEEARALFARLAEPYPAIGSIRWVDPGQEQDWTQPPEAWGALLQPVLPRSVMKSNRP